MQVIKSLTEVRIASFPTPQKVKEMYFELNISSIFVE